MYCKKCGNPIKETDSWCSVCGAQADADSRTGVQAEIEAGTQNSAALGEGDIEARHTEFTWNVYDFPKPKKTEDLNLRWTVSELRERAEAAAKEKRSHENADQADSPASETGQERTASIGRPADAADRQQTSAGPEPEIRSEADAVRAESVKEIEKFFTFTKRNEDFQRLLDAEYEKLKNRKEGEPYIAPEMTFPGHERFDQPDVSDAQSELERMILEGTTPVEEADPIEDLLHKKRRTLPVDLAKIEEEARRAEAKKLAAETAEAALAAEKARLAEEAKAEMEKRLAAEWVKEEQERKTTEQNRAAERKEAVAASSQDNALDLLENAEEAKARVEALWQEAAQQEADAGESAALSGRFEEDAKKSDMEAAPAHNTASAAGCYGSDNAEGLCKSGQEGIPVFELPRKNVEEIVTKYRSSSERAQKDDLESAEVSKGHEDQNSPGDEAGLEAERKEIKCGPGAQRGQNAEQGSAGGQSDEQGSAMCGAAAPDTVSVPDDGDIFAQQLSEMKKATESFYRQLREEREALKRAEEEAAQRIKLEQELRASEARQGVTTVNQSIPGANAEIQVTVAVKANGGGMAPAEQVNVVHAAPGGVNVQSGDQSGTAASYMGVGNSQGPAQDPAENPAGVPGAGYGVSTGYESQADYGSTEYKSAGYGNRGYGNSFGVQIPPDTYNTRIIDAEAIEVIKETAKAKNEQKQKLRRAASAITAPEEHKLNGKEKEAKGSEQKQEPKQEPKQELKENFKRAVEESWHENTLNSLFPVESGEQYEEEDDDGQRRGGRAGKIILFIIAIILILEIAALGIKYFAPESAAAAMVEGAEVRIVEVFNGAVNGIKDFFSGLSGEKESVPDGNENGDGSGDQAGPGSSEEETDGQGGGKEQPAEPDPVPMADRAALVASQSSKNKNIKEISASDELYYKEGRNYKTADINNSKPIENNIWKTLDSGETLYYDQAVVGTIIAFDSQWQDYVNNGTKDVINLTKEGSKARRNAETYSGVGKETQSFESLEIGEIRQGANGFYVWTKEQIKKTRNGKTENVTYYWIYQLQPVGDEMKIVAYTNY